MFGNERWYAPKGTQCPQPTVKQKLVGSKRNPVFPKTSWKVPGILKRECEGSLLGIPNSLAGIPVLFAEHSQFSFRYWALFNCLLVTSGCLLRIPGSLPSIPSSLLGIPSCSLGIWGSLSGIPGSLLGMPISLPSIPGFLSGIPDLHSA
jgi:hypothetical protein